MSAFQNTETFTRKKKSPKKKSSQGYIDDPVMTPAHQFQGGLKQRYTAQINMEEMMVHLERQYNTPQQK